MTVATSAVRACGPHPATAQTTTSTRRIEPSLPPAGVRGYDRGVRRATSNGLFVAIVLGSTMATNHDARAVCGRAADVFFVPYGDRVAPLDTHVRLTLPTDWQTHAIDCSARYDGPTAAACQTSRFDLVLRTAPAMGSRVEVVTTTARASSSGDIAQVELVPTAPLRARTRYEVWHEDATRRRIVATFETGDTTDRAAPTWKGIKSAARVRSSIECDVDGIDVVASQANDDTTPPSQIRYGVWVADERGRIDYDAPPLVHVAADGSARRQGGDPDEITIPLGTGAIHDFVVPARKSTLKLGLRAIDLAGHASAPSETSVKL